MISNRTYARMDRDDRLTVLREMSGDPLPTGRREEPAPSFIAAWRRAARVAEQRKFDTAFSREATITHTRGERKPDVVKGTGMQEGKASRREGQSAGVESTVGPVNVDSRCKKWPCEVNWTPEVGCSPTHNRFAGTTPAYSGGTQQPEGVFLFVMHTRDGMTPMQ